MQYFAIMLIIVLQYFAIIFQHLTAAHKDWVTALNFVPNENILISSDRRGVVKLWDANSCKLAGILSKASFLYNATQCFFVKVFRSPDGVIYDG